MSNQTILIRGKRINTNVITGLATRKQNALVDLERFANAGAAQAIVNGNLNWLIILVDACKLKSGKLDKDGQLAVQYIKAHTTGLNYNSKAGKFGLSKPEKRGFAENGTLDDGMTFSSTLAEFINQTADEKEDEEPKAVTGKSIIGKLVKIIDSLDAGLNCTDKDEALTILDTITRLQGLIVSEAGLTIAEPDVDQDMVAKMAEAKPTSTSTAAPKKNAA